jgi:hypothetical protein
MSSQKVTSLTAYRNRDSLELVEYLAKRCDTDDMRGLFVVSIDRKGRLRAHATGKCKEDIDLVMGKILSLTVKRAATSGRLDDPTKL